MQEIQEYKIFLLYGIYFKFLYNGNVYMYIYVKFITIFNHGVICNLNFSFDCFINELSFSMSHVYFIHEIRVFSDKPWNTAQCSRNVECYMSCYEL